VAHKENWANGDDLIDVSGVSGVPETETVPWGYNGFFYGILAWPTELDAGEYDLILDLDCTGDNGKWTKIPDTSGGYITDPIWPFTVTGPTQPAPIPEFSTMAIPVVSILGLLFLFNYRKRRREG